MAAPLTEWTETRIAQLRHLWADGWSASHIAHQIGGTTRNAVIGKVHRLGLPGRKPRIRMRSQRMRLRRTPRLWPQLRDALLTTKMVMLQSPEPVPLGLPLEALTECTCHWPHGDPLKDFGGFCGHPVAPGNSYCAHHHRRAHQ
jgi:GcrA cell cycle regulator